MPEYTVRAPDGKEHKIDGPAGATDEQIIAEVQRQLGAADKTTRTERLGMGAMDPIYGMAQVGARMTDPGGEMFATESEQLRQQRTQAIDQQVREREEAYQKRRGAAAQGIDWMRGIGAIPTTAALSAPLAVGGGIPAAVALGGYSGLIQPTVDFEKEKTGQVGWGAALGGVFGVGAKYAAAGIKSLGAYLMREYPENTAIQAIRRIAQRYQQDRAAGGATITEIIDSVNAARAAGKPAVFADFAGENIRGSGGTLAREQGEAKGIVRTALNERQRAAGARLDADLARFVHDDESMLQTGKALQATRAGEAAEPYAQALDPTRVVDSDYIRRVLGTKLARDSIKEGIEAQEIEAVAANQPFSGVDVAQYLVTDQAGNITGVRGVPNMRILDAVKKGFDRLIEKERNEVTGKLSSRGRDIDGLRRSFLEEIDRLNPDYAKARAIWSGHSASIDALNAGKSALRAGEQGMAPEELAAYFRELSPGDQEFFRLGVATHMREVLYRAMEAEGVEGSAARDLARRLLSNEWTRRQLAPIFRSPEDFEGFMRAINTERRMFETRTQTIGGSHTGERRAEDTSKAREVAEEAVKIGHGVGALVGHGNPLPLIKQAWNAWTNRAAARGVTANEEANSAMARILFGGRIDDATRRQLIAAIEGRTVPGGRNPAAAVATGVSASASPLAVGAGTLAAQPSPLQ